MVVFLSSIEALLQPLGGGRISVLLIDRTRMGRIDRFSVYFGKKTCGAPAKVI